MQPDCIDHEHTSWEMVVVGNADCLQWSPFRTGFVSGWNERPPCQQAPSELHSSPRSWSGMLLQLGVLIRGQSQDGTAPSGCDRQIKRLPALKVRQATTPVHKRNQFLNRCQQ
jgi:hypothetical protein